MRTSVFAGGNNLGADGLCLSGCIPMREPRWTGNRPMHLVCASQSIPITPNGRTGNPVRPALQALPEKGEPMSRLDEFLRLLCGSDLLFQAVQKFINVLLLISKSSLFEPKFVDFTCTNHLGSPLTDIFES